MILCAFCGRENDAESRFCIDCGKPLNPSAARVGQAHAPPSTGAPKAGAAAAVAAAARVQSPPSAGQPALVRQSQSGAGIACARCGKPVTPGLPFCGHCGGKISATGEPSSCSQCGNTYNKGVDLFCARCGNRVGQRVSVEMSSAGRTGGTQVGAGAGKLTAAPKLALIGESGEVVEIYALDRGEAVIGRGDADIRFENDHFMSPLHARLEMREGILYLRDLGSRNGSWMFIDAPTKLTDGDLVLIGSQLLRFRRLGYPGPHPPEADATRRMGSSIPTVDIAVMEQIRADGSVRDVFHLSPGRTIAIGRETGDWIFPYDATMSGKHAEIRSEDSEFFAFDANSRNGVAMAVRGQLAIRRGQRILTGDQILRLESP